MHRTDGAPFSLRTILLPDESRYFRERFGGPGFLRRVTNVIEDLVKRFFS
jgi:hypothetical protein